MVTGVFDLTSIQNARQLDQERRNLGVGALPIQACHIFNDSTMVDIDPSGTSKKHTVANKVCTATVSPVLRRPSLTPITQTDYAITAVSILRGVPS